MPLLNGIYNIFKKLPRIILLTDLKTTITPKKITNLILSGTLGILNSILKILIPASLAKAVEMIAKSEETCTILGLEFSSTALLYTSTFLTACTLTENQIRDSLLNPIENSFAKTLEQDLIKKSHEIPLLEQINIRNDILNAHLLIHNNCAHLPKETINSLVPSFFDICLGTYTVWNRFDNSTGLEFMSYALFNLLFYNGVILCLTQFNETSNTSTQLMNQFIGHEYERLAHAETIRMNNRQTHEINTSYKNLNKLSDSKKQFDRANFSYSILNKIPIFFGTVLLISRLFNIDKIDIDDIEESIFLLSYFNVFGHSVNQFNSSLKTLLNCVDAIDKINSILGKDNETIIIPTPSLLSNTNTLEFHDVTFGYKPNNPILKNISFSVPQGQTIAIVGKTGSGKSTLARLLLRLYDPSYGKIKLNGTDINTIPLSILRSNIAYVNQFSDLFEQESLKYNVLYGAPQIDLLFSTSTATSSKNYRTFDSLSAHEEKNQSIDSDSLCIKLMNQSAITKFSSDINTPDITAGLSGGEKQQLSIARALAKNADLFLFDEPTSALDSFTEYNLLANLKKITANKTTIIIAHRLSTIKNADQIIVLDEGCIAEKGTHDELLNKKGRYYNYWELQSVAHVDQQTKAVIAIPM